MIITVYSKASGEILRTVSTPDSLVIAQLQDGEGYVEGSYPDDKFYISGGIATLLPEKPSQYHIFNYTTKQWVDPRTPETEWPLVRAKRNRLLAQSDWTQLPDVPLATKESWAAYRQQLRDVTNQTDPFNIVWPTAPN